MLAVGAALVACGGSESSAALAPDVGRPMAAPAMEVLPPVAEAAEFSRRMRFAWLLAEQTFELPVPEPPLEHNADALRQWADGTLQRWLADKSHGIEVARRELDIAAEEAHRQRIVAGAIVGLMYEDIARVLREVPVPNELIDEPEVAEVYRDVVEFQASPFLEHARRAYRACAANAIRPADMRHWSSFCAQRADLLPPARGELPRGGGAGETHVEVSVDSD